MKRTPPGTKPENSSWFKRRSKAYAEHLLLVKQRRRRSLSPQNRWRSGRSAQAQLHRDRAKRILFWLERNRRSSLSLSWFYYKGLRSRFSSRLALSCGVYMDQVKPRLTLRLIDMSLCVFFLQPLITRLHSSGCVIEVLAQGCNINST